LSEESSSRSGLPPASRYATLPLLVFIRHGETDWNREGRLQGQRDIPLNDTGRAQARRNGTAIKAAMPEAAGFDFIASPLSRSRETMEIVRAAMGLEPSAYATDDRLKELTFGAWEGFTGDDLREVDAELIAAREKDKWAFVPPNGESYRILSERVAGWLGEIVRPTFVVAHGGVGRVLRRMILDLDPIEAVSMFFPQDKVLVFREGKESWI
jgi:broad specificity phosphatase PhoE